MLHVLACIIGTLVCVTALYIGLRNYNRKVFLSVYYSPRGFQCLKESAARGFVVGHSEAEILLHLIAIDYERSLGNCTVDDVVNRHRTHLIPYDVTDVQSRIEKHKLVVTHALQSLHNDSLLDHHSDKRCSARGVVKQCVSVTAGNYHARMKEGLKNNG